MWHRQWNAMTPLTGALDIHAMSSMGYRRHAVTLESLEGVVISNQLHWTNNWRHQTFFFPCLEVLLSWECLRQDKAESRKQKEEELSTVFPDVNFSDEHKTTSRRFGKSENFALAFASRAVRAWNVYGSSRLAEGCLWPPKSRRWLITLHRSTCVWRRAELGNRLFSIFILAQSTRSGKLKFHHHHQS